MNNAVTNGIAQVVLTDCLGFLMIVCRVMRKTARGRKQLAKNLHTPIHEAGHLRNESHHTTSTFLVLL